MGTYSVDIVLPCRNEAAAILDVLSSLPSGWRPVVVDNGSTDGTASVARAAGAFVVEEIRPGYGAAVHAGLLACTADWVATMDCDGSVSGADALLVAGPVLSGAADLGLGRRVPVSRSAWPWHARLGTRLIAGRLRRRGVPVHDIAPVRFAARTTLLALDVRDRRSGYPVEFLLKAGAQGLRIAETDVVYRPRATGTKSKVSGSVRGTVIAARDFSAALR